MSKNRTLADIISNNTSKIKSIYTDSDSVLNKTTLGLTIAAGTATYSSTDLLPGSASDGDQALVTDTNRLYIYSGSGWYNIALINNTPYWVTEASSSYQLNKNGTSTVITILAVDSDGTQPEYIAAADSDFNQMATITKDSDNGRVFIVTPIDSESGTSLAGSGTVTFKASDGINLVSTVSTFSISFIIDNSNYTTLLVKAAGGNLTNQLDGSSSPRVITEVGNVTSTAYTPYHPGGYSTYFDGTGDYLRNGTTLTGPSAATFTIECWVYMTANPSNTQAYLSPMFADGSNFSSSIYLFAGPDNDRVLAMYWWDGAGQNVKGNTALNLNQWYHIAFVVNSNDIKIYVDGVEETLSGTTTYSTWPGTNNGFEIGSNNFGTFSGYIRDLRVTNTAVYTSAFTPPTESLTAISGTQLLVCHAPYLRDGSSQDLLLTIAGNTSTKRFGPFNYFSYEKAEYGGSVYFDGTGDWLTIANGSEQMVPEAGDFTVEFWFYTSNASTRQDPWSSYTASTGWAVSFSLTTAGDITPYYGNSTPHQTAGGQFKANVWNHFAMARSGTSLKIFMNGKTIYTDASDTRDYSGTSTLYIGAAGNETNPYNGYISDARFVKGTAVYTADFTPPTAPLTAITNTSLLTCTNKNDIWDVGQGKTMNKSGSVIASNTQRKFTTGSAIYFDGDDALEITKGYDDILYNFGTHDWTVEGWFYFQNLSGARNLLTMLRAGATATIPHFYSDGSTVKYYVSGADRIVTSSVLTLNTWHHIAWVRNGNEHKIYVDGTASGTTWTQAQTYTQGRPTLADYYISLNTLSGQSNLFTGYMQDVRFTKGLARYTANFTPPTKQFEG